MPKNPEKIKQQIDKLQDDLRQAEKDKRDKNQKKISRAAERSGLDKVTLSTAELESQFKQIAKQKRESEAAKPAQAKPASAKTGPETSGNAGDSSTLKRPADSQQSEQHRHDVLRR